MADTTTWHGWLPSDQEVVTAVCGCIGTVAHVSDQHGGHVSIRVSVPHRGEHPQHVAHVGAGVIEHFRADQIQTRQPALVAA